jgi:methionine biosynthesis protein MetW
MLFFGGTVPVTKALPNQWYDTPNLRFLSIRDFRNFCHKKGFTICESHFYTRNYAINVLPNLRATDAIFVIEKNHAS